MNKSSPNKLRIGIARVSAGIFLASALVLAVSGLIAKEPVKAQSKTPRAAIPTSTPAPYCDWPPIAQGDKDHLKEAFEKALDQSVADAQYRATLLDCNPLKCDAPKEAIKAKLKELYPNDTTVFPDRLMIIFYEQETSKGRSKSRASYPQNHCYSVLHLPPFLGHAPANRSAFKDYLRCCYDPW